MPRAISLGSALVALIFLVLVLADATLVDRRPPTVVEVRLSATAGGDRIAEPITSINVVFSEAVRTSSAEPRFHLTPDVPGSLTWDGPTLIFTPSEPLPAETNFVVSVDPGYLDLVGNVASTGLDEWAFATAGPPAVVVTDPTDGDGGLSIDGTIQVEFDRLMDTAAVESAIAIEPDVPFSATWAGARVTLQFEPALEFGTTYTLTIGTAAADTAGLHLVTPFVTRFSTLSAGLDTTVLPADGVAGIATRSTIAVAFGRPIDAATADGALTITPSVVGSLEVVATHEDGPPAILLFTPTLPLAENTTYTVTLATVVHRLDDPSQVAAGRTWSFTTGSQTESAQNQIAFLSDRSGVQNVWLMNPDGTNARQLTWELTPVASFDVTGDGRRLVYDTDDKVLTVNVDGNDARVLTAPDHREGLPRFSPNDSQILLARSSRTGADLGWWLVPAPGALGDEQQVVIRGAPIVIFPNGEDIQKPPVIDDSGHFALVIDPSREFEILDLTSAAPAAGGTPTGILSTGGMAWDATAGQFAVTGTRGENEPALVYRIGLGGTAIAVAGTDAAIGPLAVAGTDELAYLVDVGPNPRWVRLLDPPADRSVVATGDDHYVEREMTFSPDGRRLVVERAWKLRLTESAGLWLIDLESRTATQLTVDGSDPRWLP